MEGQGWGYLNMSGKGKSLWRERSMHESVRAVRDASRGRFEMILNKKAGWLHWSGKRDSCGSTTGGWPSGHRTAFQRLESTCTSKPSDKLSKGLILRWDKIALLAIQNDLVGQEVFLYLDEVPMQKYNRAKKKYWQCLIRSSENMFEKSKNNSSFQHSS